jgi:hypothetical protein
VHSKTRQRSKETEVSFDVPGATVSCECGWTKHYQSYSQAVAKWEAHLKAGECAFYMEALGQQNFFGERKTMIDRKRYAGEAILRTSDFKDGQVYTIDWFKEISTALKDKAIQPAIHISGFEKYLPLNVTNLDVLLSAFSDDEEKWKGQKIRIRIIPTKTPAGAATDGVRIEIPAAKGK